MVCQLVLVEGAGHKGGMVGVEEVAGCQGGKVVAVEAECQSGRAKSGMAATRLVAAGMWRAACWSMHGPGLLLGPCVWPCVW